MNQALRLIWLTALALTATAFAGSAAEIDWQVEAGFGGWYSQGAWAPLRVTLQNNGRSRSGRIVIPMKRDDYSSSPTLFTVPVDLPQGSRKSYRLLLPRLDHRQRIRLEAGGENSVYEVHDVRRVASEDLLTVVLGGGDGALGFLSGTPAPIPGRGSYPDAAPLSSSTGSGGSDFMIAQARWGTLPESWLGWDGTDAVVLTDGELGAADAREIEALRLWVRLGGTLVVTGGARAPSIADGPLGDLLPMDVSGTRTVAELAALERWGERAIARRAALIAEGTLREGAEVLLGTQAEPLVVRKRLDAGAVVMATFDLMAEPVKYWDGQEALWRRLVGAAMSAGGGRPDLLALEAQSSAWRYGAGSGIVNAAGRTEEASLPPLWLVTGFLVAYIVALVPLNYWFVNRLQRRELAWLTTPVIILVFFGAAWGTGFALRGHQTLLNRVAVVQVEAGQRMGRARGYAGIFSPAKTDYMLRLEETAAVALAAHGGQDDRLTMEFGPEPRAKDIALNMWSTRVLEVPFVADLGEGISGYLEWNGSDLTATVRNNTGLPLKSVGLVRDRKIGETISLAPGQEGVVAMRTTTDLNDQYARAGSLGDRALAALFNDDPYGYGFTPPGISSPHRQPWIAAVHDRKLMPVELEDARPRVEDATVIAVALPVRVAPGKSTHLPTWLITSRMIGSTGRVRQSTHYDYDSMGTTIEAGSATWEFTVPTGARGGEPVLLEVSVAVDASALMAPGMGPGGPAPPAAASAYTVEALNLRSGQWVPTVAVGQRWKIPNPAQCMTDDGKVQVRVRVGSGEVAVRSVEMTGSLSAE